MRLATASAKSAGEASSPRARCRARCRPRLTRRSGRGRGSGRDPCAERGELVRLVSSTRGLLVPASAEQRQQPNRLSGKSPSAAPSSRRRFRIGLLAYDAQPIDVDERPIGAERQPEPAFRPTSMTSSSPGWTDTAGGTLHAVSYSSRKAVSGLMRVARRAGTAAPRAAMTASPNIAASVVKASAGFRPYTGFRHSVRGPTRPDRQ